MKKAILLVIIVLLSIGLGIGLGNYFANKNHNIQVQQVQLSSGDSITKDAPIVGVTSDGNGIAASMSVEVKSGTGLVLVNINDLLADYESQLSARNAAIFAENYTKISLKNKDVIYHIRVNASIVAGPSAGVSMAIATVAALENKNIKPGVFMTGAIDSSGAITGVGGVGEKAKAAKIAGAKIFIIPKANYITSYVPSKKCQDFNDINYCEVDYNADTTSISKLFGLDVLEFNNVRDALGVALE